jgi:hypothetical protein
LTPRGQNLKIPITKHSHLWGCCSAHSEVQRSVQHHHHTCIILLQRGPPTPLHQALGDPNACGGAKNAEFSCVSSPNSSWRWRGGTTRHPSETSAECCQRIYSLWANVIVLEVGVDKMCQNVVLARGVILLCGGLFFLGTTIPNVSVASRASTQRTHFTPAAIP